MNNKFSTIRSLILVSALAAGCSSISSQSSNTLSNKPRSPAQQAWYDLQAKSDASAETGFAIKDDPWKQRMDDEKHRADTEADHIMSSNLPIQAIDSMVDEISQYLVDAIPAVPEAKNSPTPLVLAFANFSAPQANPQLDQALASLRSRLAHSGKMNNNFIFVTTTETDAGKSLQQLNEKKASPFSDLQQHDQPHPVAYDPQSIFFVSGKIDSVKQPAVSSVQIVLNFNFTHVPSGAVLTKQFTRSYMWNPDAHQFELQP